MKNKIIKLFIINFFITLFFLFVCEVLSYNFIHGNIYDTLYHLKESKEIDFNLLKMDYNHRLTAVDVYTRKNTSNIEIPYNKNKRPVLVVGCSYAYGQGIKYDKTFFSQIQKYTQRETDNVTWLGFGPGNLLMSIIYMKDHKLLSSKNYEYVVYVLMFNHVLRGTYEPVCSYLTDKYNANKNNSLKDKFMFYAYKLYTVKLLTAKIFTLNANNLVEYNKYMLAKIFDVVREEIPDVKCILLIYDDLTNNGHKGVELDSLNPEAWLYLKNKNVDVISTKDLVGDILYKDEYKLKMDTFQEPHHPNDKAWDVITPAFIKKLNL